MRLERYTSDLIVAFFMGEIWKQFTVLKVVVAVVILL